MCRSHREADEIPLLHCLNSQDNPVQTLYSWACSQPPPYKQNPKMCFFPFSPTPYPAGGGFGGCSVMWCCGAMDETPRTGCPQGWLHPEQQNSSLRVPLRSMTHPWPHATSPAMGTSIYPCCHKLSCSLRRGQTLSHHLHASCTASNGGICLWCPSWGHLLQSQRDFEGWSGHQQLCQEEEPNWTKT